MESLFCLIMNTTYKKELLKHLINFISTNKKELFYTIIENRTKHITLALEDIFQPQNASAVLRSCDVFGIQDVHIIENKNTYTLSPDVTLGSNKWINMYKYNTASNNTLVCINNLKKQGYKIIATTPHEKDNTIDKLDLSKKNALFFGTEKEGLSSTVLNNADGFAKIPMYGFTESLNISVSAAICNYELTKRLKSSDINWQLTEEEKTEQLILWCKKVIKKSDLIEEEFLARYKQRN